jgi:hypothetical protein
MIFSTFIYGYAVDLEDNSKLKLSYGELKQRVMDKYLYDSQIDIKGTSKIEYL